MTVPNRDTREPRARKRYALAIRFTLAVALVAGTACRSRAAEAPPAKAQPAPTPRVRPAAIAGSWYPGDSRELGALVDRLLDAAPGWSPSGPVRALLAPHAGIRFSGAVAAAAYRTVRGQPKRRVIVLGPAHHGTLRGASVTDVTHYRTPLGDVPVDGAAIAALRGNALFSPAPEAHVAEHSIEMQLPFLQRALPPGWTLVPVLVAPASTDEAARIAAALRPLVDERTLIVASGDFTHFGPNYGYRPFPQGPELPARLRDLDQGAFDRAAALDTQGLAAYHDRTKINACALGPLLVLTRLLPPDSRAHLVQYDTSGAGTGDYTNSVSYIAAAFTGAGFPVVSTAASEVPPLPIAADEASLRALHSLASWAVRRVVEGGLSDLPASELDARAPKEDNLRAPAGAFVTLKKHGSLRGCIGFIEARMPLWQAIARGAVSAALRDSRFSPVRPDELAALDLEVSVLGPLAPIPSWQAFRPGRDGIVLQKDGRQSLFLPEVATEQGWSREDTLHHLSLKAGLPGDAWREGARFEVFSTRALTAPLPGRAAPGPDVGGR